MPCQRRTLPEPVPPEPVASSAIPRDRRAWDVARDAAAAIRTLNHLTLNHLTQTGAGYGEPADLDAVLVELSVLAAQLGQALDQARAWLNGRHDVGAAVVHETRPGQTTIGASAARTTCVPQRISLTTWPARSTRPASTRPPQLTQQLGGHSEHRPRDRDGGSVVTGASATADRTAGSLTAAEVRQAVARFPGRAGGRRPRLRTPRPRPRQHRPGRDQGFLPRLRRVRHHLHRHREGAGRRDPREHPGWDARKGDLVAAAGPGRRRRRHAYPARRADHRPRRRRHRGCP